MQIHTYHEIDDKYDALLYLRDKYSRYKEVIESE